MPTNRFHGLGLWPSIPVLLARVPHQTADCFYRPGTALRGMTAGKGGEELYKQKQALNVSYALDSYHSYLPRPSQEYSDTGDCPHFAIAPQDCFLLCESSLVDSELVTSALALRS
jgi:hypothetical protein